MPTVRENRTLVIEGDLLRVQRTTIEREVKTSDFISEIARTQALDTGVLPRGCVWYARRATAGNQIVSVYVIERPAGMQSIRFKASPQNAEQDVVKDLALSWPFTLWFIRCAGEAIQDLHLAAIYTPVADSGRDTELHCLLMPNQYDGGHSAVCLGNLVVKDGQPLAARVEELVRQMLESLWNSDLMPDFKDTGIAGLEDWAEHSAANPEFHTQIRFPEHDQQTFGGMLAHLLEEPA